MPSAPAHAAGPRTNYRPKAFHLAAACIAFALPLTWGIVYLGTASKLTGGVGPPRHPGGTWLIAVPVLIALEVGFLFLLITRPVLLSIDDFGVWRRMGLGFDFLPWQSLARIRVIGSGDSASLELFPDAAPAPNTVLSRAIEATGRRARLVDPTASLTITNRYIRLSLDDAAKEILARAPQRAIREIIALPPPPD